MKHVAALVVVAALAVAAPAHGGGHRLDDPHVGWSKQEIDAQKDHSSHVVAFFTTGPHRWMVFPRHASCDARKGWRLGRRARNVCDRARQQLAAHRWLYNVAVTRWERLYAPKPAPALSHDVSYWVGRQIAAATVIGRESGGDPWPNCPDPYDGGGSWYDTVACENGGSWLDSPGHFRCGLQFEPAWERRFGQLCP